MDDDSPYTDCCAWRYNNKSTTSAGEGTCFGPKHATCSSEKTKHLRAPTPHKHAPLFSWLHRRAPDQPRFDPQTSHAPRAPSCATRVKPACTHFRAYSDPPR